MKYSLLPIVLLYCKSDATMAIFGEAGYGMSIFNGGG